jgi:hypothetical protein
VVRDGTAGAYHRAVIADGAATSRAGRSDGLRLAATRIGLPAWFVVIDLLWIAIPRDLAVDARHYQRATTTWLQGGDPWSVTQQGVPFAAGPHTLLFYVPTSVLPLDLAVVVWMLIGLAASIFVVRRLGLPLWWLLFPPLAHALWNGNPQTLMLALLIVGAAWASALAVAVKLYAGLVLLFRPRQLIAAGIVLLVTMPLIPWQLYLESGAGVSSHLVSAWNGSAWRLPILLPPTLLALWVLRRRAGEWWSVPAVWPAIQFYYVSTALPAVVGRPILAALIALPIPLIVPIIVMVLAVRELLATRPGPWGDRWRSVERRLGTTPPSASLPA